MTSLFQIIIGLASAVGVLSALFIWRARKVTVPPALPCGCAPREVDDETQVTPAPGMLKRFLATIDFLTAKKEWRYGSPWILLLGQQAAGKTSLLESVSAQYRQIAHGHQRELVIKGTNWYFFGKGFLIDPIGKWPAAAAADKKDNSSGEWARVLDQLDVLRPERALDGILLVVSAKTLLVATPEQRLNIAENSRQQLRSIGERFEFSLPVYIVVTATDAIEGFSEFWRSQPEHRRNEMIGWSAPVQFTDELPEKWADTAFDYIDQQLKTMQVDTAAHGEQGTTQDIDQFFLFPHHFQQLHAPFQEWLSVVFQPSAWKNTSFCRGIYFTGNIAAPTAPAKESTEPRSDVAFVNDLLLEKVLAEPLLGRPTRSGIWSRNRTIRTLQFATIIALISLILALWFAATQAYSQVDRLVQAMKIIDQAQKPSANGAACISQDIVYDLISQIAKLDTDIRFLPLSFFDTRLRQQSATRIADNGFKNIILPGLACQLSLKARQLIDSGKQVHIAENKTNYFQSRAALFGYVQEVTDYEKNAQFFERLIGVKPAQGQENVLKEFIVLSEYAYGTSLTSESKSPGSVLPTTLAISSRKKFSQDLMLPIDIKEAASNAIVLQAKQLQNQLVNPSNMGTSALKKLQDYQRPISTNAKEFSQWLNWMRQSWLGSSASNNPILETENALAGKLNPLIVQYGYPANMLSQASQQFDAKKNYAIAMKALSTLELLPYGRLFTEVNKKLGLNPSLVKESDGLIALAELDFMRIEDTQAFTCQSAISGWRAIQIDTANAYVEQYQNFIRSQALAAKNSNANTAPEQAPLFGQIALHQLQDVLNDRMQTAQIASKAVQVNAIEMSTISPENQQQNQASMAFTKVAPSILKLQQSYAQYNFSDSAVPFPQCVQRFATKSLAHIKDLADKSQLYRPALNNSTGQDDLFFSLGSTQDIKDYLTQQFSQVQTFVTYATPFLSYLQNQRNATNPPCPAIKTTPSSTAACSMSEAELYWSRSIDEINAYLPTKDSNAQVSLLENLFLTILPKMSSKTCGEILTNYASPAIGNGLFSFARQAIELPVNDSCKNQRNKQANALYDSWAKRFNDELSLHYPFSDIDTKIDAAPMVVQAFFSGYEAKKSEFAQLLTSYETKSTDAKKTLSEADKNSWSKKLEFIQQLNSVAKLFHGNLVNGVIDIATLGASATPVETSNPSIKLNVIFNAQASASPGSDQIVNWSLGSGAKTISYPNNGTNLDWLYGQVLSLDLVWANQSKWSPSSNGGQSDLQIDGATATFSASGDWALFRFIDRHRPTTVTTTTARDSSRLLLEFNVPVTSTPAPSLKADNATAKLYLTLNLTGKDPKTQAPVSLKLPAAFPRQAPR